MGYELGKVIVFPKPMEPVVLDKNKAISKASLIPMLHYKLGFKLIFNIKIREFKCEGCVLSQHELF